MKRFISRSITAGFGPRLLQLDQHRDVRRLEQAERDHRHDADDDVARDDPAVQRVARLTVPSCVASCQPAASVSVTTVGMISTIFGISRVVNSTRAGIDMLPMIGPSTRPRKRSITVHAAPPATCRNSSGQSLLTAIADDQRDERDRDDRQALRGTISKSRRSAGGAAAMGRSTAMSAILRA